MSVVNDFGQSAYLKDAEFVKIKLSVSHNEAFYEPCEYCLNIISELPGCRHTGYYTGSYSFWICEECFNELKDSLNWKIIREEEK